MTFRILPRRLTLRTRLTIIYGGLFLAAGVVLLAVTYALFANQIGPSLGRVVLHGTVSPSPNSSSPSDIQNDGTSEDIPQEGDPLTGTEVQNWLSDQGALLREETADELRAAAAESLLIQGGIALVVVGGVAVLCGWLVAGQVLSRLRRVTATAHRISEAPAAEMSLHERIGLTGPHDEVKELADAFDAMVERLDRSFAGQRRFVANASHELRTPLTVGRAMVEMAMHRPDASADVRSLGADLLVLNARHEQLIAGLLDLAGAENGPMEHQEIDLADIVEHVLDVTAAEALAAGITITADVDESPTTGDALLLDRLVTNLVENGIRHNDDDGWLLVTCALTEGHATLTVENTGPQLAAYDIPVLFQPFRRLGGDRLVVERGVGLGLSIVDALVRAHDGTIDARPRDGGGLFVTVRLPVASPGPSRDRAPQRTPTAPSDA